MPHPTDSAPSQDAFLPSDSMQMAPLCAIFRRHLKEQDLKYTPERADILNAIIGQNGVFEADTLMQSMREQGQRVSKATVYRTLKLLIEAGIINYALFDEKQAHYQLVYGRTSLDTMICVNTGRMILIESGPLVELRDQICSEHGWDPVGHRFQIYGISSGQAEDADS